MFQGFITATKSSLPTASSSVAGITKVGASSEGAAAYSHAHGNITNDGKVGSTSGYAVYTTTGGSVTSAGGISSLGEVARGLGDTASKMSLVADILKGDGGVLAWMKAMAQYMITGKISEETAKKTGFSWNKSLLSRARDMSIPDVAYTTPTAMSSPQGYLANAVNKNLAATTNFNISNIEINGVQNPVEFAEAFESQINRYWQTKLTENKVYQ